MTYRAVERPTPAPVCMQDESEVCGDRAALATLVATLEGALMVARALLDARDDAPGTWGVVRPPAPEPMNGEWTRRTTRGSRNVALSPWEAEVLGLLAAGRSNRQIAQALYVSPRTVQRHIANLYLKTGAHCRAEATAYALRHGLT